MGEGSSSDAQIAATSYLSWCKRQPLFMGSVMAVYIPGAILAGLIFGIEWAVWLR